MSNIYWQAKLWGLLHDPALKALHNNYGRGKNSFWRKLTVMQDWVEQGLDPEEWSIRQRYPLLEHILQADHIASASDRGAIGSLGNPVDYGVDGLEIRHLLSGASQYLKLKDEPHRHIGAQRPKMQAEFLLSLEEQLLPLNIREEKDARKVFWWLWRCLPQATCQAFADDDRLLLMPAETRMPDSSIWSHVSITAALAGTLAGFDLTAAELTARTLPANASRPCLAVFTFSPVQEVIKASRKVRDFWAGSWLLHYLSAKVAWALAWQYGPDTLLYPALYAQPLTDHWLLKQYPDFDTWLKEPRDRELLTAGFPNVLVIVLPEAKVEAAMQYAKQVVKDAWRDLGDRTLEMLQHERQWMRGLNPEQGLWSGWLDATWQTYWTAMPIGDPSQPLKAALPGEDDQWKVFLDTKLDAWLTAQNRAFVPQSSHPSENDGNLFGAKERDFLTKALEASRYSKFYINTGSWWPYIFDRSRAALAAVKNARTWKLPTAFGVRSSISGLGSALHEGDDWTPESIVKEQWQQRAGLFDGREMLNATETIKRCLHQLLPDLLDLDQARITYPDLTGGVAGYLRAGEKAEEDKAEESFRRVKYYRHVCEQLLETYPDVADIRQEAWGIPWADEDRRLRQFPSRLINPGWLVEDLAEPQQRAERRRELDVFLKRYYSTNPSSWYVLAAGDGDGMSNWLKGKPLTSYRDYSANELMTQVEQELKKLGTAPPSEDCSKKQALYQSFQSFLTETKRMGPSTHAALSRALLDFSNQLVPYLTEHRYAGRLIYGGGDDVLAYTNLWEWDQWLWDIRQCFQGGTDPRREFDSKGDYWHWRGQTVPTDREGKALLSSRPLFTMGSRATISFGIVVAHQAVPLAIALQALWEAEAAAKEHHYANQKKDAVQVRVLYANGNQLYCTCKFAVFRTWQALLQAYDKPALFEQAALLWAQHPIPEPNAVSLWVRAFVERRDIFQGSENQKALFTQALSTFLATLWAHEAHLDQEAVHWLKLAAFVHRNRTIPLRED